MVPRRRAAGIAVLAMLLASVVTLASPAAAPARADTCDGVWVVVDARALGGSITTRCAAGTPGSGLAALDAAGHGYGFVPNNPGMVCTIDARPDPCNGAPVDAFWSYWHAPPGGSWTYSSLGAGNRTPPAGGVEGWRFGDGSAPPGTPPPANEPAPPTDDAGGGSGASTGDDSGTQQGSTGSGGADTTTSQSRDAIADEAARTDQDTPDQAGPDDTAADDQGTAASPGWQPDPVETGEWANPPDDLPVDPAESDAAAPEVQEAGDADADTDGGQEETATEPLAAAGDGASDRTTPVGALTGLGLLAGIGALTYRQRRLRTEVGP